MDNERPNLYSFLGIEKSEIRKVLLMQGGIFLIICASLIVKPIANGLFLAEFGADGLPVAFLLTAVFAGLMSFLYTRALRRYSVIRIFRLTSIFSILILSGITTGLILNIWTGPMLFLLYIWVSIFALIAASQFWIIANFVFSVTEAKRLFGLVGAAAIAGAITGGYLTSFFARIIGSEYLLYCCAGLLLLSIPVLELVWKKYAASRTQESIQRTKSSSNRPWRLIRKSKHLTYLTAIVFTGVLVAKLIDFQFADIAVRNIRDPDKLTSFFGFWFSTFNVVSLCLQLFVTRRILEAVGVGSTLFFLPGLILVAASVLLAFPELMLAAVFLKMADASLKQSVNKASMELLYVPIPAQVKNNSKVFIDVFVDSIATGFTGLILIFIIKGLNLPGWVVSVMIIVCAIIWIRLAFKVRREYAKLFSRRIEEAIGLNRKKFKFKIDFSVVSTAGIRRLLKRGTKEQMLGVIRQLQNKKDDRLSNDVLRLLNHADDEVAMAVIRYLRTFKKNTPEILARLKEMMYTRSQALKIEIFEYLFELEAQQRDDIIHAYLSDENYAVRTAALVSLVKAARNNRSLNDVFDLPDLIGKWFQQLDDIADPVERKIRLQGILLAMGYARLPQFFPVISSHLDDPDYEVWQYACIAAGKTEDALFVPELINFLAEREKRKAAIDALSLYGHGILHNLREYLQKEDNSQILKYFPAIAENIPSRESVEFCFELLAHEDQGVRQEAISALNKLKENYPEFKVIRINTMDEIRKEVRLYHDTLSILYAQLLAIDRAEELGMDENEPVHKTRINLIELLESKMDNDLENIFHLLGLHYAFHEMPEVYKVLRSDMRETRADALEFLENLMDPRIKKELMPIIEAVTWQSITDDAIQKLNIHIPGDYACFKTIIEGSHSKLKLAVIHLLLSMNDHHYIPLIEMAMEDDDESVREFAAKVYGELMEEK